jgi:exopolysaccharide biosynthesis predicted pyruvyltransferase EpsI
MSIVKNDSDTFELNKNLVIALRSNHSYQFAIENFEKTKTILVPDIAFFLGNITPLISPIYDILILRRLDKESKFTKTIWENAYEEHLTLRYSFIDVDWHNYTEPKSLLSMGYYKANFVSAPQNSSLYLEKIADQRNRLINKIMSQGKVIVTDRLHASIYAVLLGKPHVIVDDRYKKIFHTRENAFQNKPECGSEHIQSYYARNPRDAIKKAVEFLKMIR